MKPLCLIPVGKIVLPSPPCSPAARDPSVVKRLVPVLALCPVHRLKVPLPATEGEPPITVLAPPTLAEVPAPMHVLYLSHGLFYLRLRWRAATGFTQPLVVHAGVVRIAVPHAFALVMGQVALVLHVHRE